MYRALNGIKKNTAPGRDGIDYQMLKLLPEEGRRILLSIFNSLWNNENLADAWHRYQVMFIDKIGKEKVRPIALSSCVGKLMERMVVDHLIW